MNHFPIRKNTRLKDFDYNQNGAYFVTICTQNRLHLFGSIVGADSISARMDLNPAGQMIDELLNQTINMFPNVKLDCYTIMPNHIHILISIMRADMESAPTISAIVQSFKRHTTVKYINGVKTGIYPSFNKQIWQRSFHDHVIRDETDYQEIWQYIDGNPSKWTEDCYFAKL